MTKEEIEAIKKAAQDTIEGYGLEFGDAGLNERTAIDRAEDVLKVIEALEQCET